MNRYALAAVLIFAAGPSLAGDQSRAQCPAGSAITSGSSNVTVGGKQAARAGDTTGCGSTVTEGSSKRVYQRQACRGARLVDRLRRLDRDRLVGCVHQRQADGSRGWCDLRLRQEMIPTTSRLDRGNDG
jgi:hypothetical protein